MLVTRMVTKKAVSLTSAVVAAATNLKTKVVVEEKMTQTPKVTATGVVVAVVAKTRMAVVAKTRMTLTPVMGTAAVMKTSKAKKVLLGLVGNTRKFLSL